MNPAQTLPSGDIENIERATIAAVSPESVEEIPGWLLPFDHGTVSRAYSAVPLQHLAAEADPAAFVDGVMARYEAQGLRAVFRLATVPGFDSLRQELARRHYWTDKPVLVQVAEVKAMRAVSTLALADVDDTPDTAWAQLFLGEGFDPVDGASRVKSLSRAKDSVYASVRENGQTIAAGAMAFGHGWCSVHGMRTDLAFRRRGLAGRVLAGLAEVAIARSFTRVFLQVEEGNGPAVPLYARAGFSTAWRYEYWRPAQA